MKSLLFFLAAAIAAMAETPMATWPPSPVPPGGNSAAMAEPRQEWIVTVMKRAEAARKANLVRPIELIFDGDSITDSWRNTGRDVWAEKYESLGGANFGNGGDKTQNLLWRLQAGQADGLDPKLVVLLIGTNNLIGNTPDEIAGGIGEIVTQYEKICPRAKILLLGLLPRAASPDDALRGKAREVNEKIALLAGERVVYLDIGGKFLEADGTISKEIMPDFLHLSAKGYQLWADAIQPVTDASFPPKAVASHNASP